MLFLFPVTGVAWNDLSKPEFDAVIRGYFRHFSLKGIWPETLKARIGKLPTVWGRGVRRFEITDVSPIKALASQLSHPGLAFITVPFRFVGVLLRLRACFAFSAFDLRFRVVFAVSGTWKCTRVV